MILGMDYEFCNVYDTDTTAIKLLTELYKNVIFRFTNVGIKENPEDDSATLRFSYEILSSGEYKEDKLRGDQFFEQHLGLILNSLILDVAELDSANREGYSEESVEELVVFEEGSPVSKD